METKAAWGIFEQSGKIADYLGYKGTQQAVNAADAAGDADGFDCNDGAGAS